MRVIAGDFKGRRLTAPKGTDIRPTSDRVKEAIFSMVQADAEHAVCLDLFAGTGALGIEALSRGAKLVYFCDNSPAALEALRENLDACGLSGARAIVFKTDLQSALRKSGGRLPPLQEKCNLVFIDAPYEMCEYYSQILIALATEEKLEEGARIIIERDAGKGGYTLPDGFIKIREKRYGSIGVDLLIYGEDK